jgi:hypothetical protein
VGKGAQKHNGYNKCENCGNSMHAEYEYGELTEIRNFKKENKERMVNKRKKDKTNKPVT